MVLWKAKFKQQIDTVGCHVHESSRDIPCSDTRSEHRFLSAVIPLFCLFWFNTCLDVVSVHQAQAADLLSEKPEADGGANAVDGPDWRSLYEKKQFKSGSGSILPYRILSPGPVLNDTRGKVDSDKPDQVNDSAAALRYPLVLFLHGAGERGDDNEKQLVHGAAEFAKLSRRQKYPCFAVFPQCPDGKRWVESDWDLPSGDGVFPLTASEPMSLALSLVDELVETLPIDSTRIYVTGLSMGGMGTWYAAASEPKRFAAMLEVCGGGDPSWASRYAGIPIWAFHGQADTVVPVERGREMIRGLSSVGHWPELRYVEYPKVGHNSWSQTYSRDDVFDWLFSQRKQ